MLADSTPVPHYKQSNPGACLPACARVVLASFGDERTESELAVILESYEFGTPANRVTHLEKLSYQVEYGTSSLDELRNRLKQGSRVIVFVYANFLPWADFDGFHALVLAEITSTDVMLLDPTLNGGPTQLSIDGFLVAWEEFDCLAAIVSR
jgi:hypothetical protein